MTRWTKFWRVFMQKVLASWRWHLRNSWNQIFKVVLELLLSDWSGDVGVNDLEKWESIRPLACAHISWIMVIGRRKDTSGICTRKRNKSQCPNILRDYSSFPSSRIYSVLPLYISHKENLCWQSDLKSLPTYFQDSMIFYKHIFQIL